MKYYDGKRFVKATKETLLSWIMAPPVWGECVICGEKTCNTFGNPLTGCRDFVHDYSHNGECNLDCKIVWRYQQRRERSCTWEQFYQANYDEFRFGDWLESDYHKADFLDERDFWHDYKTYIASREWQIKANAAKRLAGWHCQRCGERGNATTLHAHHKHYRTLYKERPQDIEVLCAVDHALEHGL